MSISQAVYKWHTFVPVRFSRAVTGAPQSDAPDLDDRGFRDQEHGPVMGMTAGETVRVKVRRTGVDDSADLWVTSTDASIVSVTSPEHGHLPSGASAILHARGHRGSGRTPNVQTAKLQVHFGNESGPVVAELMVWVFRRLLLSVTPHLVTIRGTGGSRTSIADIPAIMRMARGIWRPCGIELTAGTVRNEDVTYANAGIVNDAGAGNDMSGTDVARILNTHWVPDTINVYFVHRIGTEDTLGYGFPRADIATYHLPNPGIIIADTDTAGTFARDVQSWASTVGHEVGHFLRLEHAGNRQSPHTLDDSWAHRMLMYNFSLLSSTDFLQDVGYGNERRGTMITMKDLPQIDLDAECGIARNTATARGGPY